MKTRRILIALCTLAVPLALTACGPSNGNGDEDTGTDQDTGTQDTGADTVADTGTDGGGDADTGGGGTCSLDIAREFGGNVSIHPVTGNMNVDPDANLKDTELYLVAAISALQTSPDQDLQEEALPMNPSNGGACVPARTTFSDSKKTLSWSLKDVDVAPVSLAGTVGITDDANGSNGNFVQTATGITDTSIKDMQVSEATNAQVYAVSDKTMDKLASISSKSRSELMEPGIMLGRFVDSQGDGVADVQVGVVEEVSGGDNKIQETIDSAIYPNDDFSDATTGASGGSTASHGTFIVPDRSLTTFGGTKTSSAGDSLDTSSQQGATAKDTVFTITLQVN